MNKLIYYKFLRWTNFDEKDLILKIKDLDPCSEVDVTINKDDPFDSSLKVNSEYITKDGIESILKLFTKSYINNETT